MISNSLQGISDQRYTTKEYYVLPTFQDLFHATFWYKDPFDISKCIGYPLRYLSWEKMQIAAFVAPWKWAYCN